MSLPAYQGAATEAPYRVMVVDDSAVIRGLLARWLEADGGVKVVASVGNGVHAVKALETADAEVAVLDIEMPEMDGMTALPKLLAAASDLQIIMSSTLTRRNAEISVRALELGAADYIPKATTSAELHARDGFRTQLVAKVKALGAAARKRRAPRAPAPAAAADASPPSARPDARISLRKEGQLVPEVLAIGSSTGGPHALKLLFGRLKTRLRAPIFITQHMPATFTAILAEHLSAISGAECAEGKDGEPVVAGRIYVAPGGYHMTVAAAAGKRMIALNQDPPESFCRPAVDPMLRSLVRCYGGRVLAIILTGMGYDGLKGGQEIADSGGSIIAQDEATSVVWGMPGAVATAGLCASVLPIDDVAERVVHMMGVIR